VSHAIKFRRHGDKRFTFVGYKGSTNLRIRALRYATHESAREAIDRGGPHIAFEFKVVDLSAGGSSKTVQDSPANA